MVFVGKTKDLSQGQEIEMLQDQMTTKDMDVRALSDNELDTVNGGFVWIVALIVVALADAALLGAGLSGGKGGKK